MGAHRHSLQKRFVGAQSALRAARLVDRLPYPNIPVPRRRGNMRHKEGRPSIGHGRLRRLLTRLSICKVIAREEAVDGKWTAPKLQKAA